MEAQATVETAELLPAIEPKPDYSHCRPEFAAQIITTSERARELAARSNAVQKARRESREAGIENVAVPEVNGAEEYIKERIKRTRRQIEMLDRQLNSECERTPCEHCHSDGVDAKAIKSIADAIAKLAEVERILSGRPLPGARRPGKEQAPRRTGNVSPLD